MRSSQSDFQNIRFIIVDFRKVQKCTGMANSSSVKSSVRTAQVWLLDLPWNSSGTSVELTMHTMPVPSKENRVLNRGSRFMVCVRFPFHNEGNHIFLKPKKKIIWKRRQLTHSLVVGLREIRREHEKEADQQAIGVNRPQRRRGRRLRRGGWGCGDFFRRRYHDFVWHYGRQLWWEYQ